MGMRTTLFSLSEKIIEMLGKIVGKWEGCLGDTYEEESTKRQLPWRKQKKIQPIQNQMNCAFLLNRVSRAV